MPGRDNGFTLLELLLSLTALALVLQGFYVWKQAALEEAAVQRTVDGFVLIDEAAYAFHVEQARWPTSLTELRDPIAPLLPPLSGTVDPVVNGVGGAYVLAVIAPDLGVQVTTTMQTHEQAQRVQRSFPHRTLPVVLGSSDVVFQQRVAPKDSTDHQLLVWRDGSRTMTGNLDFDGNEAVKVRRLKMQNFDTEGGACTGRGITTKSDGTLMECVALKWRPVGQSSEVECMWTGWQATGAISGSQRGSSYTPPRNMTWRGTVGYCDSGKITHVDVVTCDTGGRMDDAGQGSLGPSAACLNALAAP